MMETFDRLASSLAELTRHGGGPSLRSVINDVTVDGAEALVVSWCEPREGGHDKQLRLMLGVPSPIRAFGFPTNEAINPTRRAHNWTALSILPVAKSATVMLVEVELERFDITVRHAEYDVAADPPMFNQDSYTLGRLPDEGYWMVVAQAHYLAALLVGLAAQTHDLFGEQ